MENKYQFLLFSKCFRQLYIFSASKCGMCGNGLTLYQTSPGVYVSAVQVLENTVGKGEIAHNEQFHLFPQGFLPI